MSHRLSADRKQRCRLVSWISASRRFPLSGCLLAFAIAVRAAQGPGAASSNESDGLRKVHVTEEQEQILNRTREYATAYISNLPNFVCIQITHRFSAGGRDRKFKPLGEYRQKLNFVHGQETYEPIETHTVGKKTWHAASIHAYARGDFGTLMRQVLVADKATFAWLSWDTVDGTRAAVFAYHVDLAHSTMHIESGDEGIMAPYHGLVFANPIDGSVLRITSEAEDIPPSFDLLRAGNEVNYGHVAISGKDYLLPTLSIFSGVTRTGLFRNEAEFSDYQKFGAESELKYETP